MEAIGWASLFYIPGSCMALWCIFWAYCVYDTPHAHPRIKERIFMTHRYFSPLQRWRVVSEKSIGQ